MTDNEIPEEIARRLRPLGDSPVPDASPALAAFLADPGAPVLDHDDLPAATAQAPAGPNRRHTMKDILGDLLGAVARLGLVGKVALGVGALAVAGMGSAAAVGAVVDDTSPSVPVVQTVDESSDDAADEPTTASDDADDDADDAAGSGKGDDDGDESGDDSGSSSSADDDADDQGEDGDEDSDHKGGTSSGDHDEDSDDQGGSDGSDD